MATDIFKTIEEQVKAERVVVYMKGTPDLPQCGFSKTVCEALRLSGAEFTSYNVLDDPELRQAIKQYSDWPTIPQLYIDGELVGGCDIVVSLYESGGLEKTLAASD